MALIRVQLETNFNTNGVAWYAYFDVKATPQELESCFNNPKLVESLPQLGYELAPPEEVPTSLSKAAKFFRYFVAEAV